MESINKVAGREVEVTIRGERSFTFSFDRVTLHCIPVHSSVYTDVIRICVTQVQLSFLNFHTFSNAWRNPDLLIFDINTIKR